MRELIRWFQNKQKAMETVLFIAWCYVLLRLTLLSRTPKPQRIFRPDFLYELRKFSTGSEDGLYYIDLFIKNILLFVPCGLVMPWKKNWKQVTLIGLFLSGTIEIIQYITRLGECEIDDIIANTLGAAIGYGLYVVANKILNIGRGRNEKA